MISTTDNNVNITINNIGGLSYFKKTILPGLNIIEEPNAFGKTSFLRAISLLVSPSGNHTDMAHVLKLHENEGSVSIENSNGSYTKTIARKNNTMVVEGDNLVEEGLSQIIKNFAIGGSDNEILTAIRNGKNLEKLLTDDFNTEMMRARLTKSEKLEEDIKNEIKDLTIVEGKLPALIINKEKKEKEIVKLQKEKEEIDADLKKLVHTADENDENIEKFKKLSQNLIDVDSAIAQIKKLLANDQQEINNLKQEKIKLEKELQQEEKKPKHSISEIEKELKTLNASISPLESGYNAISLFVDGTRKMLNHLTPAESSKDILSSLSESKMTDSSEILCPCCAKKTTVGEFKAQLESYVLKANQIKAEINTVKNDIKTLREEKETIMQIAAEQSTSKAKIAECQDRITTLEDAIFERRAQIITKEEEKKDIEFEKKIISEKIDTRQQELTDKQGKYNRKIGELKNEIEQLEKNIAEGWKKKELLSLKKEELKAAAKRSEKYQDDLTDRKERLIKQFNEAIKNVYSSLNLDVNFSKITLTNNYDIVVERQPHTGNQPYTDKQPLKTLSKSELEIIGLVVMISGYIINELKTKFPYIVLDELTFLDPDRLSKMMSYILPYTESVILTKLPSGDLTV